MKIYTTKVVYDEHFYKKLYLLFDFTHVLIQKLTNLFIYHISKNIIYDKYQYDN